MTDHLSVFREELATFINSCVRVSKCVANCQHSNKVFELPTKVVFVLVNILQLAYLGVMFDSDQSQIEVALLKWYFFGYIYTILYTLTN